MDGDIVNLKEIIGRVKNRDVIDVLVDIDNNGFRCVLHADGTYSINPDEATAKDQRFAWIEHQPEEVFLAEGKMILAHPFGDWTYIKGVGNVFRSFDLLIDIVAINKELFALNKIRENLDAQGNYTPPNAERDALARRIPGFHVIWSDEEISYVLSPYSI